MSCINKFDLSKIKSEQLNDKKIHFKFINHVNATTKLRLIDLLRETGTYKRLEYKRNSDILKTIDNNYKTTGNISKLGINHRVELNSNVVSKSIDPKNSIVEFKCLTELELKVVYLKEAGYTHKEIAEKFNLKLRDIDYMSYIIRKKVKEYYNNHPVLSLRDLPMAR